MKPTIPTPAQAVRLVFKRACMSISREYAFLAQGIDARDPKATAVEFTRSRRKAARKPIKGT